MQIGVNMRVKCIEHSQNGPIGFYYSHPKVKSKSSIRVGKKSKVCSTGKENKNRPELNSTERCNMQNRCALNNEIHTRTSVLFFSSRIIYSRRWCLIHITQPHRRGSYFHARALARLLPLFPLLSLVPGNFYDLTYRRPPTTGNLFTYMLDSLSVPKPPQQ